MATQRMTTPPAGSPDQPGSGGVTGTVKQAAGNAVDSAKQAVGEAASTVREKTKSRVDQERETTASGLATVADAVRRMGEDLKGQEQGAIAEYAARYGDTLAGQINRTSEYLRTHDASQIVTDVENFARRRPGIFVGGAFLLGVAASRFLKSSRPAPDPFRGMPDPARALPPATPRKEVTGAPSTRGDETRGETPQSAPSL